MKKYLLILGLGLLGCVSTAVTKNMVKNRYAQYGIQPMPAQWINRSFRGAELFFQHQQADASIYINSSCEKLSDSPLEALTSQALVGMGHYEIISQDSLKIDDREGMVSQVLVKLDGVERYIKIMVMRKNRCVFDAVFSSSRKNQDLVKDFDDMLATFWAKVVL